MIPPSTLPPQSKPSLVRNPGGVKPGSFSNVEASALRFGTKPASATPTSAQTDPPLNLWEVAKNLKQHMNHGNNGQVMKGFAYKYGTEAVFPFLFAIPVVGWAMGIVGMPLAYMFNKKGSKQLDQLLKESKNTNHPALKAESLIQLWGRKNTPVKLFVDGYNDLVESLFPKHKLDDQGQPLQNEPECPHNAKLRNRFKVSDKARNSRGYQFLERLVNAKNALEQHVVHKLFLGPLNSVHNFFSNKVKIPRFITRIILLPRYAMLGIFFMFKRVPK